jgi:hypothetical protein
MDGLMFDAATRSLATRRRMLGGVVGGVLAVFAGSTAFAAKNKRKRGDKDDEGAKDDLSSGLVGGIWDNTLDICQFDAEGGYRIIAVPMPSVPDYLNKGATVYIDCCVDGDCHWRECLAPSGCVEGACMYDATPGAECNPGNGLSGICNQKGTCEAIAPPEPVVTTGPIVTTEGDVFPPE